jgi:hypothetical protein
VRITQSLIGILDSNAFKPLIHVIRPALPYTHSLKILPLHISLNTYLWPYAILFHEFFMRETPTLTLRRHHLKIHIGEVHIVSFPWDTIPRLWSSLRGFENLNPLLNSQHYYSMPDLHPNQRLVVTHWILKLKFC